MADIHVVYLTIPTAETDMSVNASFNTGTPNPSHTYW